MFVQVEHWVYTNKLRQSTSILPPSGLTFMEKASRMVLILVILNSSVIHNTIEMTRDRKGNKMSYDHNGIDKIS